jgi:ribosomal protein L7/L12
MKLTHEQFRILCDKHEIRVEKIGTKYVHIAGGDPGADFDFTWRAVIQSRDSELVTLRDAIATHDSKIMAIRIIRDNTGMSLMDAKNLVVSHWGLWQSKIADIEDSESCPY